MSRPFPRRDLVGDSTVVAPRLLNALVSVSDTDGSVRVGRIVEVEAYRGERDPASHAYRGPTARNATMFGPPGLLYVYRSYGIHWCLNFVCREEHHGAGVLIRAIEPQHGVARMIERRGVHELRLLCSGPGRVGQALGIVHAMNGCRLDRAPFRVLAAEGPCEVVTGPRIGISKAAEVPWRFGLAGSKFVSRPFPRA